MFEVRRRLPCVALMLTVLQIVLAFWAPVAAPCRGRPAASAATAECCPPGSHRPGECPLHKSRTQDSPSCSCRAPEPASVVFANVLETTAVLTQPIAATPPTLRAHPSVPFALHPLETDLVPVAPPPRV